MDSWDKRAAYETTQTMRGDKCITPATRSAMQTTTDACEPNLVRYSRWVTNNWLLHICALS